MPHIRTVIDAPRTSMFLKPVFRTHRGRPAPTAEVNTALIWGVRIGYPSFISLSLLLLRRFTGSRPRGVVNTHRVAGGRNVT